MKKILLIIITFFLTIGIANAKNLNPGNKHHTQPTVTVWFEHENRDGVWGYQLFQNGSLLCEILDPKAVSITCPAITNHLDVFQVKISE